jgi:type I restriction enzyme S subunit
MSDLPKGWVQCLLGDVVKIQNGYAFPSKDFQKEGIPLIKQSNLAGDKVSLENCVYLDQKYLTLKPDYILKRNDVLIGMSGSIGKLCIYDSDEPALQNQRTGKIVLLAKEQISWRFIWEYLKTIEIQLLEKGKGLGVINVSASDIESLTLKLPPLNEQNRIVEKLEKLLGKVETVQARLDKIPAILKRFRQAVLAAACSGKLTTDWRENNSDNAKNLMLQISEYFNRSIDFSRDIEGLSLSDSLEPIPENWALVRFGEVIQELRNGVPIRPEIQPPGTPILRISAARSGSVDLSDVRYLPNSEKYLPNFKLQDCDLLFTRYNGSLDLLGVCGMVRGLGDETLLYPDKLMRVRFGHNFILPEYAEIFFQSPDARERMIEKSKSSAGQNGISGTDVKLQFFAIPPHEEQKEIVRRVEDLFKFADQIEARYKKARSFTDKLTQSILAKAFRGELVPQDPTDEPASVLLERIRQEKSAAPTSTQKPKRKAANQSNLFE